MRPFAHQHTLWNTTEGISYEPHHLRPKFWVRCEECGELFGPYFTLADAQYRTIPTPARRKEK